MRKQKVFKAFMAVALCLAIIAEAFLLPTTAVKAAQFGRTVTVTSSALKKAKANIVLYLSHWELILISFLYISSSSFFFTFPIGNNTISN